MKPEDFLNALRRTAERYGMDLSRPLALVSGGPDSVALLRALVELGGEPVVLHVDHGLRGEESREDAEFVRVLCEKLGVRCEVRSIRREEGANLQASGELAVEKVGFGDLVLEPDQHKVAAPGKYWMAGGTMKLLNTRSLYAVTGKL
jgi:tRNA(Ile)-lysidine synthase TilS/MesJ